MVQLQWIHNCLNIKGFTSRWFNCNGFTTALTSKGSQADGSTAMNSQADGSTAMDLQQSASTSIDSVKCKPTEDEPTVLQKKNSTHSPSDTYIYTCIYADSVKQKSFQHEVSEDVLNPEITSLPKTVQIFEAIAELVLCMV